MEKENFPNQMNPEPSESRDSEKSPGPKPIYFEDWEAVSELEKISLGKIYLSFKPEELRFKTQVDSLAEKFKAGDKRGYIISGELGTGKTTALHYLALRLLKINPLKVIAYWSTGPAKGQREWCIGSKSAGVDIIMIRASRLIFYLLERRYEEIEKLETCKVLMLDDFARHYSHDFPLSKLTEFIETRYSNLLTTYITLDITLEHLTQRKDWSAMVDRFRDSKWMADALILPGGSQRQ